MQAVVRTAVAGLLTQQGPTITKHPGTGDLLICD
jgi:hypothetical protein